MEKKDIVEKEDTDAAADKVFMSFVEKGYPRSARELEAFIKKTVLKDTVPCP